MSSPAAPTARGTPGATGGRLLLRVAGRYQAEAGAGVDLEPKDALLLAYLALEGPTPRGRLAALLWPEVDDERARGNLRQRLMRLKRSTGVELVRGQAQAALAEGVTHDLDDADGLLDAMELPQGGALADWLQAQRERRRRARIDALDAACTQAESAGDLAAALEHAHARVELDALSEHAHRRVMRLHYLHGDTAAAMAAYEGCRLALERELGVRPSHETEALRAQIDAARVPATHAPALRAVPLSVLRPPRLVGREAEAAALEDAWAAGGVALVTGEPGIGKTRLLEDLAAARPGVLLVSGRPGDADVPLSLVARLVQRLGAAHEGVAACAVYAPVLAVLPGLQRGTAAPQRAPLAAWIAELLRAAPALSAIVVDDLQFADDASVELLLELLEAGGSGSPQALRWAFASRLAEDSATAGRLARVAEFARATVVALGPLDAEALVRFVDSLGLDWGAPAAIAMRLHRRVGGNPLFALEALRLARGGPGDLAVTPPRVAALMDRRLAALSPAALALIRIAAIAGTDFSIELAEAVSGENALALASPWREIEAAQLMAGAAFTHDLVHEAALRTLPAAIAQRLHARVADFLVPQGAEPARIARHRLLAGQEAAAVPHLVAAARQAWAAARAQDIADFFLRAAEIEARSGRGDAAFDILFDAADALSETAGAALYGRALEMARPLARSPGQEAKLLLLEAVDAHLHGDFDRLVRLNDEALLRAIAAGEPRVEAEARFGKGVVAAHQGRLQEAIEHLAAAARLMRDGGLPRRAAAMQAQLATVLTMAGQTRLAAQTHRDALPQLAAAGIRADVALAHAADVLHALTTGDTGRVLASADLALAALRRADVDPVDRAAVGRTLAGAYRRLGRLGQALAVLDEAAAGSGAPEQVEALARSERAWVYCELGRPDLAGRALHAGAAGAGGAPRDRVRLALAGAALQLALQHDPLPVLDSIEWADGEDLLVACDALLLRGRVRGSGRTLEQCDALLERCRRAGAEGSMLALEALRARLRADLGLMREAADAASQAWAQLDPARSELLLPLRAWWIAGAFLASGHADEARRCAGAARDHLRAAAQQHVAAEFRDSFLNRHPLHRDLLVLASRSAA